MTFLRRLLGTFVMIAGMIGLLLSLAGIAGIWMARPILTTSLNTALTTLTTSVDTSKNALVATDQALTAGITSVDALSQMLSATATTVEDTQPVIDQLNSVMGETLPATLKTATDSIDTASEAALSLEGAIKSFDTLRTILSAAPLVGALIPATDGYNPEKPLADSLGELSKSLQEMPATFEDISANVDKADDNLEQIKGNLNTMSENVTLISSSLSDYKTMIGESEKSMDNLKTMLTSLQDKLGTIINTATLVLGLFFLWLLAAQVVIFSQGYELFHGTAGRMEAKAPQAVPEEPAQ